MPTGLFVAIHFSDATRFAPELIPTKTSLPGESLRSRDQFLGRNNNGPASLSTTGAGGSAPEQQPADPEEKMGPEAEKQPQQPLLWVGCNLGSYPSSSLT